MTPEQIDEALRFLETGKTGVTHESSRWPRTLDPRKTREKRRPGGENLKRTVENESRTLCRFAGTGSCDGQGIWAGQHFLSRTSSAISR
jgi:hypothetical protein